MLKAALRAVGQLLDPALVGVLVASVAAAAAALAVIWIGVGAALEHVRMFDARWLDWLTRIAVGVGTVFATIALFGAIAATFAGFLVETVARAVERRYYPSLAPPRRQSIGEQIGSGASFLGGVILINLVAAPLYLIWGANVPIFLAVNGYVLGREYFELVAMRRLDRKSVALLRRTYALRLLLAGILIAALSFLPLANLLTPVLATAFMVHIAQSLPELQPGASGFNRGLPGSAVR
jgi:uncharacterized protein involved in cysteine biosynthesis